MPFKPDGLPSLVSTVAVSGAKRSFSKSLAVLPRVGASTFSAGAVLAVSPVVFFRPSAVSAGATTGGVVSTIGGSFFTSTGAAGFVSPVTVPPTSGSVGTIPVGLGSPSSVGATLVSGWLTTLGLVPLGSLTGCLTLGTSFNLARAASTCCGSSVDNKLLYAVSSILPLKLGFSTVAISCSTPSVVVRSKSMMLLAALDRVDIPISLGMFVSATGAGPSSVGVVVATSVGAIGVVGAGPSKRNCSSGAGSANCSGCAGCSVGVTCCCAASLACFWRLNSDFAAKPFDTPPGIPNAPPPIAPLTNDSWNRSMCSLPNNSLVLPAICSAYADIASWAVSVKPSVAAASAASLPIAFHTLGAAPVFLATDSMALSLPYLPNPSSTFVGSAESSTALMPPAKAAIPGSIFPVS